MRRRSLVLSLSLILAPGCGGDEPVDPGPGSPAPVATIDLNVLHDTVVVGAAAQLEATPRDADGNALEDRAVEWSTSDSDLATVLNGAVFARAMGVVTITATSGGKHAAATIDLAPVVTVGRRLPTTFAGDTTALTVALADVGGNPLTGAAVAWSSSDESVATVSTEGIVTGVAAGTATISAEASAGRGSEELVVLVPRIRPSREISYRIPGSQSLRRIGANGLGDIQLTDPGYIVSGSDWSPSGERLAVTFLPKIGGSKSGLRTMNPDGSDERELVPNAGQEPRWSPDGTRILLTRGDPAELYVIGADGQGLVPLTQDGLNYINPEWSPDGRRIAVNADACGDLWILEYPGGNHQRVSLPTSSCYHRWSPDGKLIAYQSISQAAPTVPAMGIWLVNSDGTNPRPITSNCSPQGECTAQESFFYPRWSPVGRHLAFVATDANQATGSIQVYDLKQGVTTGFPITLGIDYTVEWSPDGTRLAFSGRHPNGFGAVIVSGVDGSGQMAITNDNGDSEVPVWRK